MRAHAIIIGIDKYKDAEWELSGAVSDALDFAKWVTCEGGVKAEDLQLFLAPRKEAGTVAEILAKKELAALAGRVKNATSDLIETALWGYENGAGKETERFWFYYAGHGMAPPGEDPSAGPLMVPSDVEDLGKYARFRALGFETFRKAMQDQPPPEQFFFIDACRDVITVPGKKAITQGLFWKVPPFEDELATQGIYLATAFGKKAKEVRAKGIFSSVLIGGLRGLGPTLQEPENITEQRLRLLFTDLASFVKETVSKTLADEGLPEAIQIPEPYLARGNLEVASFDALPTVTVAPIISPDEAHQGGRIEFVQWSHDKNGWVPSEKPAPHGPPIKDPEFTVTGGSKHLRVTAPGFEKRELDLIVYEETRFPIELVPAISVERPLGPPPGPTGVNVHAHDRFARITVLDGGGNEKATAYECLLVHELAPGNYRVRVEVGAERIERIVAVQAGVVESVDIYAAVPLPPAVPVAHAMAAAHFPYDEQKKGFEPSENIGFVANASLSTILAYAAWAARWPKEHGFQRLRDLGVNPSRESLQVLVGDAREEMPFLDGVRVEIEGGRHSPLPLDPITGLPMARQAAVHALGGQRVRLELPGFAPASFPVAVLPGLVTVLIAAREEDGALQVQQHLNPVDPTVELRKGLPPPERDDVRLVELALRALENRTPLTYLDYDLLLQQKRTNPMFAVIAGYRMLATEYEEEFRGPPSAIVAPGIIGESPLWNLVNCFPELPDVHVLAALYQPEQRDTHFERAIEKGVPMISEGFLHLSSWLAHRAAREREAPPIERRYLVGGPWTAFTDSFDPPVHVSWNINPNGRKVGPAYKTRQPDRVELRLPIHEVPSSTTMFLVGPRLALSPRYLVRRFADENDRGEWVLRAGAVLAPNGPRVVRVLRTLWPQDRAAISSEIAEYLPVLVELDVDGMDAWVCAIQVAMPESGRVWLCASPTRGSYAHDRLPDLFADPHGRDYMMNGTATRIGGSLLIAHDCFPLEGSEGGPLLDATHDSFEERRSAVGMHVAHTGLPEPIKRRGGGLAIALDWLAGDPELTALGVRFTTTTLDNQGRFLLGGISMRFTIRIHFENSGNIFNPHLWQWSEGSSIQGDFAPKGRDTFGLIFDIEVVRSEFKFKFKSGAGTAGPWESDSLERRYRPQHVDGDTLLPAEIWCRGDRAFVYDVEPRQPEAETSQQFLSSLSFKEDMFIPNTGGLSGLGAHVLADGRVLFGLYHPNAARVFLIGEFNDWQRPGAENEDPSKFIELKLYRGYFGVPNTWLLVTDVARVGQEYKFTVCGGVPSDEKRRSQQYFTDPYARRLGPSFKFNNSVIVDPTNFTWHDADWRTPDVSQLIIYELSVYGFTEGDPDIDSANRGKFKGITERVAEGYFERLGVTALSLMPLSESPSPQSSTALGYDPSLYFTVERDFGSPDDLRELVDTAHQHGLAVLLDQVFNHTSSSFNPLWQMILEHPDEEGRTGEGGLYFNGTTEWGNRIATEKTDVQNMLIDACMLLLIEYHVDGFRFDATHTNNMDHGFLLRLARKLKDFKPDVLLVAENLPNQSDLNRSGFDGIAQWCDSFHDKIKAMSREGVFENVHTYSTDRLADIFFFSKSFYAAHTNNVVNYCESHDEHSISFEVKFTSALDNPSSKERKARLALFSSLVALGQPMIYMGQEFQTERPRNIVTVQWPTDLDNQGFFQWARRLIKLRKRYPGLKISGFNPDAEGKFVWVLGPWMDSSHGAGKRVLGWRLKPNNNRNDTMVVMLNFENHNVPVTVDFGLRGTWVKLADIDFVNDVPPGGTNSVDNATALRTNDGSFGNFLLPSSSGFLYKFERD